MNDLVTKRTRHDSVHPVVLAGATVLLGRINYSMKDVGQHDYAMLKQHTRIYVLQTCTVGRRPDK